MKLRNISLAAFAVVFLDQLTKFILTNKQYSLLQMNIINYTENTGAAFSILEGYRWLFIGISSAALIILIYYTTRHIKGQQKALQISFGMLMGGMTGNLIDRIFLGYVRDFIDLKIWPVFNIADSAIFIAVIILVIQLIRKNKDGQKYN